jgi:manganese transport protein
MVMLEAVVIPHNIFLHSNVIQSGKWGAIEEEKKRLVRFEKTDTLAANAVCWLVNSAMIVVALLAAGISSSTTSEGQSEDYRAR